MIVHPLLLEQGFLLTRLPVPIELQFLVETGAWLEVDRQLGALTAKGGAIFEVLQTFLAFDRIEHILSIRDSTDPDQEDGIWHDDGSRLMAVSLGLTLDAACLEGGRLAIRRRSGQLLAELPTPGWGEAILYLTGHPSYGSRACDHKIHQVTRGRRIIMAAWCSSGRASDAP